MRHTFDFSIYDLMVALPCRLQHIPYLTLFIILLFDLLLGLPPNKAIILSGFSFLPVCAQIGPKGAFSQQGNCLVINSTL